jgi:hypothetical protein
VIVAGGRDSGIFLSVNGGDTWTLITDPFTSDTSDTPHIPRPWQAYFDHDPAGYINIYIGTQGRGVWRIKIRLGENIPDKSVGIGASVAVGLVDDKTTAEITGTLNGGGDVVVQASTEHDLDVAAKTGAKGGGFAVTPSVAIALSNVTTLSTVSSGSALSVGSFTASADQTASASTDASGSADAGTAAVGLSLGLTIANHKSEATLARDLAATGAIALTVSNASSSTASAAASAGGAPGDSTGSGSSVDGSIAAERSFANSTSQANGGSGTSGSDPSPSASTKDGGISVAAGVAINLAKSNALATIATGLTVTAGGTFTLGTKASADATATADGSASRPVDQQQPSRSRRGRRDQLRGRNEAILPAGATVTSAGATVQALSGSTNDIGAQATSGAGGGKVGVAGSVAISIEHRDDGAHRRDAERRRRQRHAQRDI